MTHVFMKMASYIIFKDYNNIMALLLAKKYYLSPLGYIYVATGMYWHVINIEDVTHCYVIL